jgi:hypothetical protein
VHGLQVVVDVPAISAQWIQEPDREVEERDVVIARHDHLRTGEGVEKRARLAKLPAARPLGEIA